MVSTLSSDHVRKTIFDAQELLMEKEHCNAIFIRARTEQYCLGTKQSKKLHLLVWAMGDDMSALL